MSKKVIKSVGIVARTVRPDIVKKAREVLRFLEGKVDIYIDESLAEALRYSKRIDWNHPKMEVLITIGGDGTMLYGESLVSGKKIPLLGVKCGRVGFLTEIDKNMEERFEKLLKGEFFIEEHIKLDIRINGEDVGDALNDVVILTATPGKVQKFSIDIHGDKIDEIVADGVIFSTATGSTAYGMSAGGPLIDPILDAYEIVPISPYKLSSRPLVVPADTLCRVKILREKDAVLVIDGATQHRVTRKDKIEITKSYNKAYFIKFEKDFFNKMKKKLIK
ncbi:MAG: NAD(+)/NADH kinase [archaeon]